MGTLLPGIRCLRSSDRSLIAKELKQVLESFIIFSFNQYCETLKIMIIILKNRIDRCPDQHPDVPKGSRLRRAGAARDGAVDGKGAKSCDGFSGPHIDSCGAATAAVRSAKRSAKLSANGQRTVSELSANCQRTVSELSANGQRTVSEAVSEADRSLVGRFSDRPLVSC